MNALRAINKGFDNLEKSGAKPPFTALIKKDCSFAKQLKANLAFNKKILGWKSRMKKVKLV